MIVTVEQSSSLDGNGLWILSLEGVRVRGCPYQAVCSEALMTMAFPVKREDIIGPMKLWNWSAEYQESSAEEAA